MVEHLDARIAEAAHAGNRVIGAAVGDDDDLLRRPRLVANALDRLQEAVFSIVSTA